MQPVLLTVMKRVSYSDCEITISTKPELSMIAYWTKAQEIYVSEKNPCTVKPLKLGDLLLFCDLFFIRQ